MNTDPLDPIVESLRNERREAVLELKHIETRFPMLKEMEVKIENALKILESTPNPERESKLLCVLTRPILDPEKVIETRKNEIVINEQIIWAVSYCLDEHKDKTAQIAEIYEYLHKHKLVPELIDHSILKSFSMRLARVKQELFERVGIGTYRMIPPKIINQQPVFNPPPQQKTKEDFVSNLKTAYNATHSTSDSGNAENWRAFSRKR